MGKKNLIVRFMKKIDDKRRIVLPKVITDQVESKEFYVELYDDGHIELIPIKIGEK
jgi:DNA-binding transcriptional regulator/RsmH inhibitor MraZ